MTTRRSGEQKSPRYGLLALCALAFACSGAQAPPPNVVLITLESLRTDHVGAYGGASRSRPELPVTPSLDELAAEGVLYEDAHAVTSWTLASHASLFTGLYPSGHHATRPLSTLADSHVTLAERLREAGYQTAGVVSGPYLRRKHNLSQGFELYDESMSSHTNLQAHADVTNPGMEAALERFLGEQRDPSRPFFLFAYFWDPHFDFVPPAPYDTMFAGEGDEPIDHSRFDTSEQIHPDIRPAQLRSILAAYAGEVRATDDLLGRFFSSLRARGLWDDTLLIVTADHGEEFFDHGEKGHKNNLFAESVRVPLVVKYPKGRGPAAGTRDARLASLVDVFPTVLELAGAGSPSDTPGRSLLAEPDPQRNILFELLSLWYFREPDGSQRTESESWVAVRRGRHKLLEEHRQGAPVRRLLFDARSDPIERHELSGMRPEVVDELAAELERGLAEARARGQEHVEAPAAELGEAERAELCVLGYLDCD